MENRCLLTGTWASLANGIPGGNGAGTMLMMSNGSVMAQSGGTSAWYKLTPVGGNYTNGNWTQLASMHLSRTFYASEVLPSGKVFVLGGEYASDKNETNAGEIYDPVANTWSTIANFPESTFGDGMAEVLSDGRVIAAGSSSSSSYIYNPSNNTWSAGISSLNGDAFSEEGWVKLPDGSLLDYQIQGSHPQTAARFVLGATDATDAWVSAGSVPVRLDSNGGDNGIVPELGPGLLVPDGRVLWLGATSNTAFYTPSTNSWAAGLTIPSSLGAIDAPAAVLPNGKVLFAASPHVITPNGNNATFGSPTTIFEYDPVGNTITTVPNTNGPNLNGPAFVGRMLVIPSGQVLYSNGTGTISVYTPDGAPSASWAPTITNITNDQGSNVFTLTGTQLNGLSEGAAYGDDAQMASNFPIVRLQDQAGNISFARTFNWSSTGVATGGITESVNFTVPNGLGAYLVTVVTNGIASSPVLDIQFSPASGENFEVQQNANANYADINLIGSGVVATFYIGAFNALIMTGDAASNTLVINCNLYGRSTTIDGGDAMDYLRVENNGAGTVYEYGGNGDDYFDFDFYSRNLSSTTNFTYVYGGAGTNSIFTYDNAYTTATTYSVTAAEVNRPGFGGYYYDANVAGVTLNTGTSSSDVTNIVSTYTGTPLYLFANAAMAVNIGSAGSVQSIDAPVYLDDSPSFMTVAVDDSADAGAPTVTMGSYTPSGDTPWGYIAGLAPANINYEYADVTSLLVTTGTGAGTVVDVQSDGVLTTLNSSGGSRTVNVGAITGGAQGIIGTLVLADASGTQTVNIDDSQDTTARTATLNYTTVNGYSSQQVTGLTPAPIQMYFSGTTALTVHTSSAGGSITNILQDAINTTAIIGSSDTASPHDAVNLGNAGSLVDVIYPITITNPPGYTDVTVNDSSDTRAVGFTESSFVQNAAVWGKLVFPTYTILGFLTLSSNVTFPRADVTSLTFNTGSSATATVQDTASPTTINEGSVSASLAVNISGTTASLTVNTGIQNTWSSDITNAGSVQAVLGPVTFTSSSSTGTIIVDDSADTVSRNVTMSGTQITGLAPGVITFPSVIVQYNVSGGSGGNGFNVTNTPGSNGTPDVINTGSGNDSIAVQATYNFLNFYVGPLVINTGAGNDAVTLGSGSLSNLAAPVTVNGGGGDDTVQLDDHSLAATDTYTVTSTTVTRPSFAGLTYSGLSGLDLEAETGNNIINVNGTAAGTPVSINANNGTDTINVNQTDPTAPVTIKPSTGNDAVNVDTTGTPGATAIFATTQQVGLLTIGPGGKAVEAAGPKVLLTVTGLAITGTGVLDMTTNDMIVTGGNLGVVNGLVRRGYGLSAGATWAAPGIDSSSAAADSKHITALGVIQNNQSGSPLFTAGHLFDGVVPGAGDVLIKYTYFGDANFDGAVDGSDYSKVDAGYSAHGTLTGWFNGDFNYDGAVDGSDYSLVDNSFNNQAVAIPSAQAAAQVASTTVKGSGGHAIGARLVAPPTFSSTTIESDLLKRLKAKARHRLQI